MSARNSRSLSTSRCLNGLIFAASDDIKSIQLQARRVTPFRNPTALETQVLEPTFLGFQGSLALAGSRTAAVSIRYIQDDRYVWRVGTIHVSTNCQQTAHKSTLSEAQSKRRQKS